MSEPNDLPQGVAPGAISLKFGHPDRKTLPVSALEEAARAALRRTDAFAMLEYGPERGRHELIDFLVERLNEKENLDISQDNLMLIAGSTHGVDLVARLLVGPQQGVLVEAPSYKDAIHIFSDHHADLHSIPTDSQGVRVDLLAGTLDRLRREGKPPRVFYTVPTFHNPTGTTIPEDRKREIIALSREFDFIIVEDEVYRDLPFEQKVPPSYFALSAGGSVLRIGSFSKTLAPGLRLGWLVGEPAYLETFMNCGTTIMGGGANPFIAQVVNEYCRSGQWDSHIEQMRQLYKERRDIALAALDRYMPAEITWTVPEGGYFLWVTLPPAISVTTLEIAALERGLMMTPGTGFFLDPADGDHHLRIAFSFAQPDELTTGIKRLAEAVAELA